MKGVNLQSLLGILFTEFSDWRRIEIKKAFIGIYFEIIFQKLHNDFLNLEYTSEKQYN